MRAISAGEGGEAEKCLSVGRRKGRREDVTRSTLARSGEKGEESQRSARKEEKGRRALA